MDELAEYANVNKLEVMPTSAMEATGIDEAFDSLIDKINGFNNSVGNKIPRNSSILSKRNSTSLKVKFGKSDKDGTCQC